MWENFADSSIYYRKTNHQQCSRNNHSKTERLVAKLFGEWKILSLFEENILSLVKAEQHPRFTDRAGLSAGGKRGALSRIFGNG